MQTRQIDTEIADLTGLQSPLYCSECGWPGAGKMPAGVRMIRADGNDILVGRLFYYQVKKALCSVCEAMEAALINRAWFVEAHAEYLRHIETKRRMLNQD